MHAHLLFAGLRQLQQAGHAVRRQGGRPQLGLLQQLQPHGGKQLQRRLPQLLHIWHSGKGRHATSSTV